MLNNCYFKFQLIGIGGVIIVTIEQHFNAYECHSANFKNYMLLLKFL